MSLREKILEYFAVYFFWIYHFPCAVVMIIIEKSENWTSSVLWLIIRNDGAANFKLIFLMTKCIYIVSKLLPSLNSLMCWRKQCNSIFHLSFRWNSIALSDARIFRTCNEIQFRFWWCSAQKIEGEFLAVNYVVESTARLSSVPPPPPPKCFKTFKF